VSNFAAELETELDALKAAGTYKRLNHLESPQGAHVRMEGRGDVIVLSSNNYLGLANEPSVVQAGIDALQRFGAGTASVRFICGTFTVHRELEVALADFVGTESALSYVSAWNANEALTPTIAREGDFVVSDALNHASIIDSVRLAKAITKCTTAVYKHADMDDLREKLRSAKDAKRRIIWTDGVFSMEGSIAKLPEILQLAREHDAIVVMDDSRRRCAQTDRTRHGRTLRRAGRGGHHHVDARQSARWRRRRVHCRSGRAVRHDDATVAPAALFQRAAADRGRQFARRRAVHGGASRARRPLA
jgi:glycine C-acetyltransferase